MNSRSALCAIVLCLAARAAFAQDIGPGEIVVTAGQFQGTGDLPTSFVLDTRMSWPVRGPLRAGFNLGYSSGSAGDFTIHAEGTRSGGTGVPLAYRLANANVDLFPLYAHLSAARQRGRLVTAAGIGGGYQLGFVSADAFQTQIFGGWGGAGWAGGYYDLRPDNPVVFLGIGAEVACNLGTFGRDTFDRALAIPVRQELDAAGWSVRAAVRIAGRGGPAPVPTGR